MKKILLSILDFILFGNLFMSFCAVAQALLTYHFINSKADIVVLLLLFFSTLCIYNFSILLTKPAEPQNSSFRRVRWFFNHQKIMVIITIISIMVLAPIFFVISFESRLLLFFLSLISFGYSLPLFLIGDQKYGLRNIPGLKSLLIAGVWTMSCVLLPIFEAQHHQLVSISLRDITILVAKRFLFIGALTIPFDVRDLFEDKKTGLKTIPVIFGEKKAYLFCQLLLMAYLLLLFMFRGTFNRDFWALTLIVLITGWLIFKSKSEKNEYYYFIYMDGILILQYALVWTFKFI